MSEIPIKLVVIDNDGCLILDEFSNYDLEFVAKMREYAVQAKTSPGIPVPQFTFITGRSQPFVECMQKLFAVDLPAIFENGAGLDLGGQSVSELDPGIDEETLERLGKARVSLRHTVMRDIPSFFQPGKDGSISIIPRDAADRQRLWEACEEWERTHDFEFEVIRGVRCVDIVPPGVDKGVGFDRLLARLSLSPSEVAGIGDSRGDLRFMKRCVWSGAPANAVQEVRDVATYVSPFDATAGVLDIMERLIARNRRLIGCL